MPYEFASRNYNEARVEAGKAKAGTSQRCKMKRGKQDCQTINEQLFSFFLLFLLKDSPAHTEREGEKERGRDKEQLTAEAQKSEAN